MSVFDKNVNDYCQVLTVRLCKLTTEYSRTLLQRDKDIRDDLIAQLMEARVFDLMIIEQLANELKKAKRQGK